MYKLAFLSNEGSDNHVGQLSIITIYTSRPELPTSVCNLHEYSGVDLDINCSQKPSCTISHALAHMLFIITLKNAAI